MTISGPTTNSASGKLPSTIMADHDERLTTAPAPLPRHERAWRHPSEIGQQRRANARRSAPPLTPFVTLLVGVLGLGVMAALIALVLPREAPREVRPVVRNAVVATRSRPTPDVATGPAFPTIGGDRVVLAVDDGVHVSFVTTGKGDATVADIDGRSVPLRVVGFDGDFGISILRADSPVDVPNGFETSATTPAVGSRVTIGRDGTVGASVGMPVAFDASTFVPLTGMVAALGVPDSSPVRDTEGRLVGLYTIRSGVTGFVPIAAVSELLSRLR